MIYDPTIALSGGLRTPFPGNIIPSNRIDPSVSAAMNILPLPNLPGNLYINSTDVLPQNNNNYSGRVDYQITGQPEAVRRATPAPWRDASIPVVLPGRANLDNAAPRNVAVGLDAGSFANESERPAAGLQPPELPLRAAGTRFQRKRRRDRSCRTS